MKNPVIAAEYVLQDIASLLEVFPQLAEDEELFKDTLEGNTNFIEVMDRLLSEMKDNETLAEATSTRIGKLRERQTRLVHRAQFYRALIQRLMERTGMKTVALPEAKISVVNSPDKVIITDEAAIPEKLFRVTKEPNKAAIKAAIKNGEDVPGASLSNGGTTIQVR